MSNASHAITAMYWASAAMVLSMFSALLVPAIETDWFPVAAPIKITKTEREGEIITFWGTGTRIRNCNFAHIRWYRGERSDRAVGIPLKLLEKNKIRQDGEFDFGPWQVRVAPEFDLNDTYADVFHQCKFLGFNLPWLTRSRLHR